MKISIDDLVRQLADLYGIGNIPFDIMYLYGNTPQLDRVVEVRDSIFNECAQARRREEQIRQEYDAVSELRLAAMEKEKGGDVQGAIAAYAQCIDFGEAVESRPYHAYAHAYKRIITCLRKVKDAATERSYIERLLAYGDSLTPAQTKKYADRLTRLKSH